MVHTHKCKYTLAKLYWAHCSSPPSAVSEAFPDIQPTHARTHKGPVRQEGGVGGGLERASMEEDGGRGTHADEPDNRQETLESSPGYFPSSTLLSGPRAGKEITNNTH